MKTTYVYPRDAGELKQLVGRRFRVTAVAHESNWGKPGYIESVLQHEGALENVSRKSMAFDGYVFASWGDVTLELLDEPEPVSLDLKTVPGNPHLLEVTTKAETPEPLTIDRLITYLRCLVDMGKSYSDADLELMRIPAEITSLRVDFNQYMRTCNTAAGYFN